MDEIVIYDEPEIFKILDEYSNYKISSYGKIINIKTNKEIKGTKTPYGRLVSLYVDNRNHKTVYRSVIIAKAFVPNENNFSTVLHKDCDFYNDYYKNLYWGTRSQSSKTSFSIHSLQKNLKEKEKRIKNGYKKLIYKNKIYDEYLINKDGIVFSLKRGKELKHYLNIGGYDCVRIERIGVGIHLLLTYTFIGSPPLDMKDPTVNHIDGNKNHNFLSNFEWMERAENSRLAHIGKTGTLSGKSKLNDEKVREICKLLNNNKNVAEIAKIMDVCEQTINDIKNWKRWTNVSKDYPYMNKSVISNKSSENEKEIAHFLTKNKIEFNYQQYFRNCKNKKLLPFDFYLSKYNLCIEFQGLQHTQPIGINKEKANNHFSKVLKRDRIKKEYCENNHINLLRIYWWEKEKFKEIILKALEVIKNKSEYYRL